MIFAGVDIGSTTSKCVLLDENGRQLAFSKIMTEFNRNESGEKVLMDALASIDEAGSELAYVVSTGYGRKSFLRADRDIPEIIAHAEGTRALVPDVRTIIDIGGQDSKIIGLAEDGTVSRFEMNDKCAAGTGRFFEVLTHRLLRVEMDELSDCIMESAEPIEISSMCTVFAESEIISHISNKVKISDIAAGAAESIARRIISMGKNAHIPLIEPIVFSGGVANNEGIRIIFEKLTGKKITAARDPQSTAALGAAIKAKKEYGLKK